MFGCCSWTTLCAGAFVISVLTYLIPVFLHSWIWKPQNLKEKYGAKWALVTGSSSGIGKAITQKLAKQGINVVMVALDDDVFKATFAQMKKDFPALEFRYVGANLAQAGFMDAVAEATRDIVPTLIFNNAGYMATGLFASQSLQGVLNNYNCNATACLPITHHFVNRIIETKQKGAVFFTSSPAGFMAAPSSVIYSSTKAFLTNFAYSLAAELKPDNIDVLVVHPSPTQSRFYEGDKIGMSAVNFFRKLTTTPESTADTFFTTIGRYPVHDAGWYCFVMRILLKILDVNALAWIVGNSIAGTGDYKKMRKLRDEAKKSS